MTTSSLKSFRHWLRALFRNRSFWTGLAVLLLAAAGFYVLFNNVLMPQYTRYGVTVTVPDVVGVSLERAQQTLRTQGFEVEKVAQRYDPNLPEGAVMEQSPAPSATVKPGRRIYLTVNSGKRPMVQIPPLEGTSVRAAKNRLLALGLEVTDLRVDSIPSPYAGTITRQMPPPGDSLPEGAGVVLWYSDGNRNAPYVTVPDVTGRSLAAARRVLLDEKLRSVVIRPQDAQQGGTPPAEATQVTRQTPEGARFDGSSGRGRQVPRG